MPSNSTVVDVTYNDPRTGERVRERRVQEIPYVELQDVRQRELAAFGRRPRIQEQALVRRRDDSRDYREEDNPYTVRRSTRRERFADDNYLPPPYPRRSEDHRPSQRRDDSPSDSDSSRERRRRRRNHRRARSERGAPKDQSDGEGICWYSHKKRSEANFLERNFDSSYDGLFAAGAGALIGAMTARRFGPTGEDYKRWRTIGGAVAGAVAFNAAENHYRVYTEEREERKQDHWEAAEPLELAGEAAQNAM